MLVTHDSINSLNRGTGMDLRHLKMELEKYPTLKKDARDAIRTHEPLQEWILSPSELAGLSYPRTCFVMQWRSDTGSAGVGRTDLLSRSELLTVQLKKKIASGLISPDTLCKYLKSTAFPPGNRHS